MNVSDRIAEEHRHKIDHFILSETATGKTHLLFDGSQHPLALEVASYQRRFPEPTGKRGRRLRRSLDTD